MKRLITAAAIALSSLTAFAANPQVELNTSMGKIVVELYPEAAPLTVANFLQYVDSKHYDGTIFHRVIPGFMTQGGGFTAQMEQKPTKASIQNEAKLALEKGLGNERGTIAMARTGQPHSATSQFFINYKDNSFLNYPGQDGYGYTVFGRVISGMAVADQMATVTILPGDTPAKPIVLISAKTVAAKAAKAEKTKASSASKANAK
ncbi:MULTISPECIES: peptidylprolyl isomerase [Deefgea]|uniref:Peptidyl-prolyl cis-trans isomerase n=1 Tax=Deefgea chitinilytica TaxID=570276 RepID=A0ABS2CD42_9NEIS|nr:MULTISPECIES: peptidylprolyl isomerase [Deefgea]MBM5571977.1 peptidyl-prolyl cis-trans isomerase [Deefgea chitinilytica]MBM9889212.1 peptidylprolyl isomerase [Deefgea sp. CFH1-16]